MTQSSIEWTQMTWNPTTGCNKISAGCKYCYAEVMTRRLMAMGIDKYKDGFEVRTHEDSLQTGAFQIVAFKRQLSKSL